MRAVLAKMNGVAQALPWFILGLAGVLGMMGVLYPGWVDAKLLIGGLLFAGPVLMIWLSCVQCSAKRRLHHWQTVWQIATVLILTAALSHDTISIVFPSIVLGLVGIGAVTTMKDSLFVPMFLKAQYNNILRASMFFGFAIVALDIFISLETKETTRSPVFAHVCTGLACLVLASWRWALWYWGTDNTLSREQHPDVWSRQQNTGRKTDVWFPLLMYSRYNDPQPALDLLPVSVLLDILDMPTVFALIEEVQGFSPAQLLQKAKQTINQKEPRAIPIWELYDEKDALVALRQLVTDKTRACETLELPALC